MRESWSFSKQGLCKRRFYLRSERGTFLLPHAEKTNE